MISDGRLQVSLAQAVAYRLRVNHLVDRLPANSHAEAAYVGLQDSAPRDAILGMHARMDQCQPTDWEHPSLLQTYSPRQAVYVLPAQDFGLFTLGTLPLAADAIAHIEQLADDVCRTLSGRELRGGHPGLRQACGSGRIALRWTTSALWFREIPRPEIDITEARRALCLRHIHRFGPTTPTAWAWWTGLPPADARAVWNDVADHLLTVDLDGEPAWIRVQDEEVLRTAQPPHGVRLLVSPDLRLLGQDRGGRFIGPGRRPLTPAADSFHPNGVLYHGEIVGAWGRTGGKVDVILTDDLPPAAAEALGAEVAALPIRNGTSLHLTVGSP